MGHLNHANYPETLTWYGLQTRLATKPLDRPHRHFDSLANFPFVDIGNPDFVVEVVGAG